MKLGIDETSRECENPLVNTQELLYTFVKVSKKEIIRLIENCFEHGGKLIWLGNGGSMAESTHASTEFIGIGLPSISLSDPATITALANDFGYEEAFSVWIEAIWQSNDLIIGISSSGKSENINRLKALTGLQTYIDFPRKGNNTSQVQENQLKLIHEIYEYFKNKRDYLVNRGV